MDDRSGISHSYQNLSKSLALQEQALEEIPEATSSNYRGKTSYEPHPLIYVERAEDAILEDVDGNEYIDLHCGVSSIISGHNPPELLEAVSQQLDNGPYFATAHQQELEAAKKLNDIIPGSDRTKFASSGTEAVMAAIRLARAYTGKEKVLKFEGMYHGHSDEMMVNVHPHSTNLGSRRNPTMIPDTPGIPQSNMQNVISIPWNDPEILKEKLDQHSQEIAAVITEAVASNSGLLWPADEYLGKIRKYTDEYDVLFILDEVVTGFRMGLQGAQGYFDIEPDLAIYGKALANGYPCAALTGKATIMDFINGAPDRATFMGTFSGNPVVTAAANSHLDILQDIGDQGYNELQRKGKSLVDGMEEILVDTGFNIYTSKFAGFFYLHFLENEADPTTWQEWREIDTHIDEKQFARFASGLISEGVFVPPPVGRLNLTHAHTREQLESILEATKTVAYRISDRDD